MARSPAWLLPWTSQRRSLLLSPLSLPEAVAAVAAKAVEATEDNSPQPEAISTSQAVSPATSSLGRSLSSLPAVRRRPPASAPLTWLGWDLICASFTGPGETKPATVWPPAAGRETRPPGACQRPRSACLRHRPPLQQAFPCRHWSRLQHSSCQSSTLPSGPPLAGPNGGPIACWGEPPFPVDFSSCCSPVPDYRC